MNIAIIEKPSMTSFDISALVGSRHDSVKRTIERLSDAGIIQLPPSVKVENKQSNSPNRFAEGYRFEGEGGKRDSIVVVAQLCPEFTARLVDRWQALEKERLRPKSHAEMIAEMAMLNLEQERRINQVEALANQVNATVEQIRRGTIPAGWVGDSLLRTKSGLSDPKCRALAEAFHVPCDSITIMTPDGQPRPMKIVLETAFFDAFRKMMSEAERRNTRWFHPALGIFQVIGHKGGEA